MSEAGTTWHQVEFYSDRDKRWVPLLRFDTPEEAEKHASNLPRWRVSKVTLRTEVVTTGEAGGNHL